MSLDPRNDPAFIAARARDAAGTGTVSEDARLSRLLFEARELAEMLADIVEMRGRGRKDDWSRRFIAEVDAYRAERGWSPHGFGGE